MKKRKNSFVIAQMSQKWQEITKVFELRNKAAEDQNISNLGFEYPFLKELPIIDKSKIDYLNQEKGEIKSVKENLIAVEFNYNFNADLLDSFYAASRQTYTPNKAYISVIYYQMISLCFLTPELIDDRILKLSINCLTKCALTSNYEFANLIFSELLNHVSNIQNFQFTIGSIDAIISYFGLIDTLEPHVYPSFIFFMRLILTNPAHERTEQNFLLLIRLIAEKRKFIFENDIVDIELLVFPFAYNFEPQAIYLLSQLTKNKLDGYLLEAFSIFSNKIVNYVKQNEEPLIVDTEKHLLTNTKIVTSQQNLNYKTQISDADFDKTIKLCNPVTLLSNDIQKIITNIVTNIKDSAKECLHILLCQLTQKLSAHENERFYYTIMAVYFSILSNISFNCSQEDIKKAHLSNLFSIKQSIYEEDTLDLVISALRTDLVIFYSSLNQDYLFNLFIEFQNDPIIIGELASRLYANKIVDINPNIFTIIFESTNKLKFFDSRLTIMAQYGMLCYINLIFSLKPQILFENRNYTYCYLQYLSCDMFADIVVESIESCFSKRQLNCNLIFLSDFINDHSVSQENSVSISKLISIISRTVYNYPNLISIAEESLDFILDFAVRIKSKELRNNLIKIFITLTHVNKEFSISIKEADKIAKILDYGDTDYIKSQIPNLLTGSSSSIENDLFVIINSSFILPLILSKTLSSATLDLLIELAEFSHRNIYKIHQNRIDYILLNSLKSPFDYDCIHIDLKLDPLKVLKLIQQNSRIFCSEAIIKEIISVVKHRPDLPVTKYFNKALVYGKNTPKTKYCLGTGHPIATVIGLDSSIFDYDITFLLNLKVDNTYLEKTDACINLFTITDDEGRYTACKLTNHLIYVETFDNNAMFESVISTSGSWGEINTVAVSLLGNTDHRKVVAFSNGANLPLVDYVCPNFGSGIVVTFGGGSSPSGNFSSSVFGYLSDFRFFARQFSITDQQTDDYYFSMQDPLRHKGDRFTHEDFNIYIQGKYYYKSAYDLFKSRKYVTKLLKSVFDSKETIENSLKYAFECLRCIDFTDQAFEGFFGIGSYINSRLYFEKIGNLNAFRIILNSLHHLPQPCQVELLEHVILSLYPWISCSPEDLCQIIDLWNTQVLYQFSDIFEQKSFVSTIVGNTYNLLTDPLEENTRDMKRIITKISEFLRELALININENDIQLLVSCASHSSQPYLYLSIVESSSNQLINLSNNQEIKQGALLLVSHSDPIVAASCLLILNCFVYQNHSTEVLTQLRLINQEHYSDICSFLISHIKEVPRIFLLVCALVLNCDVDFLLSAAQTMQNCTNQIVNETIFSGIWYMFPILFAIQLPPTYSENIFNICSLVALKSKSEVKNSLGFLEFVNSKVKSPQKVDYVSIYLKRLITNNKDNSLNEFLFQRLTSHIVYRVDGPSHHDELLAAYFESPFRNDKTDKLFEDNRLTIKQVGDFNKLIIGPPRILFWYDRNDTILDGLAKMMVMKMNSNSNTMEIIEKIKRGEKNEQQSMICEIYSAYFEESVVENNNLLRESLEKCVEMTKPHKMSMKNLQNYLKEKLTNVKPKPISKTTMKFDKTCLGPFCPLRMKLYKGFHKMAGQLQPKGVCCKLVELEKVREFYLSKENQKIYLSNQQTVKPIDFDSVVTIIQRRPTRNLFSFEFYTKNRKSYLLTFRSNENNIINQDMTAIDVQRKVLKTVELWQKNVLSNFELLMKLNILSGRSFSDPYLYPFIPYPGEQIPQLNGPPSPFPPYKTKSELTDLNEQTFLAADYFFSIDAFQNLNSVENCVHELYKFRHLLEMDYVSKWLPNFIDLVWGKDYKTDFQHQVLFAEKFPSKIPVDYKSFERNERLINGILTFCFVISHEIAIFYNKNTRKLTFYSLEMKENRNVIDLQQNPMILFHREYIHVFQNRKHLVINQESCNETECDDLDFVCSSGTYLISVIGEKIYLDNVLIYTSKSKITAIAASHQFDLIVYSDIIGVTHFISLRSRRQINKKFDFRSKSLMITDGLGFVICSDHATTYVFDSSIRMIGKIEKKCSRLFTLSILGCEYLVFVGLDHASVYCLDNLENEFIVKEFGDAVFIKYESSIKSMISVGRNGQLCISNIANFKFINGKIF
ncbi:hypothetical protein TVAG_234880 [Trichomonas vaginalis G3]|uniref:BEACH domain-containing protein n=1 Tax=Trichomonas vaginalis (strain ATCC PRA-98 / G3) TaxID=412133 RepID=A2DPK7_TRIV3|nr:BEACH domain-containing protein family [Trichomonas vaginalis G3]EAY17607.1 hypothetical protein TVAG_234880 [Trichomonas vaginalis G3]KAI5486147.1 BEACH domain-containing protein family [Trichomonas vaginalis G3]|eukprot:XP_001329742.1 hypothetical protein [Trichomonas vaginalis G3]